MTALRDMLFADERVEIKRNVNMILDPAAFGLGQLNSERLMRAIGGSAATEAVGGVLHLTNYRLLFRSHAVNRITGSTSIFLPSILNVSDASRRLMKKMNVTLKGNHVAAFVIWNMGPLLSAVRQRQAGLSPFDAERLARNIADAPQEKLGGLSVTAIGRVLKDKKDFKRLADPVETIIDIVSNPLSVLTALSILELGSDATDIAEDATAASTSPPPGWYPAPDSTGLRWWNGTVWTEHRSATE